MPRQTPFTDTHPPETEIPPANVEVPVPVTVRVFIVPPLIVGLFMTVLVS